MPATPSLPRRTEAQASIQFADSIDARAWVAVASGILGAFMAILDIQITNSSLNILLGALSATAEEGSWVVTSYMVAEIIAIPLAAFFCRVFSLRGFILVNASLFILFSTLCGNAWSLNSMIVFRMLQGFTGGGLIPTAMMLVLTKVPLAKRPISLSMFGLSATLAPVIGPTLGGFLSDLYGWQTIFYINWIPGLLLLVGIAYGLDRQEKHLELLARVDWIGIFCMMTGLGFLIVLLEEGSRNDWFASPFILGCALLSLLGLIGWGYSSWSHPQPFIDLRMYARRNFLVATIISAVAGMGLFGSFFILPLFLAQIPKYTPFQIGQVVMWAGLPQICMVPVVARLSPRIDNRLLCSFGLTLFAASCFMNSQLDATTGHDQLLLAQIVRGLGQPFIMLTLSNFAVHGVAPSDIPSASSLYNMTRNLGGSVGVALLATLVTKREHLHSARLHESISLFANGMQERLDHLSAAFAAKGADPVTAGGQALQALDTLVRREAYVQAYNDCFLVITATLVACVFLIWLSDRVLSPAAAARGR